MFQNVLESISGIGLYGVISIAIFFGFFTLMLLWVSGLKKNYLHQMETLPLAEEAAAREANRNQPS